MKPRLSVVIPTLGRAGKLARVLDRLAAQAAPPFEVVVAPDAAESDRAGLEAVLAGRPLALTVATPARPGASAARNAGWRAAAADVVLFLDDDVLPEPGLLAAHAAAHRADPGEAAGVLGHVRWARGLRVTPFMRWLERGIQFDFGTIAGTDAGWGRFYTANASVKRALLERAGGFDEVNLPFGYEDLDLALRMRAHGFRLRYERAASAEHLHPMDLALWRRRMPRIAAAERRFCALHPEIAPYFHDRLADALRWPPLRGRAARLAGLVPPGTPRAGPYVWTRADVYWRQQLAGPFMAAWRAS
ncbi:MAG TPA: glycosyltransferase [Solirubrobacteraceae bacterium]